ncbi:MAG: hypothetical protein AB1458_06930 [Bacteroidota bacterium]
MIPSLPYSVSALFILTTFLCLFFLYRASGHSGAVLLICLAWLALQAAIGLSGYYTVTDTLPPRAVLMPLPALLLIVILFLTRKGRSFIDRLDPRMLTWLHIVRVPVEICLLFLFIRGHIPQLMTFEGRNFDIIAGITAPLIAYFGFSKKRLSSKLMLAWNFICLALLLNIVVHGILSVPSPFQQFAFDQPNVGILYFPFVWLPSFVVPVVLLAHLAVMRQLIAKAHF